MKARIIIRDPLAQPIGPHLINVPSLKIGDTVVWTGDPKSHSYGRTGVVVDMVCDRITLGGTTWTEDDDDKSTAIVQ